MIANIGRRVLATACVSSIMFSSKPSMSSSSDIYFYSDVDSDSCLELSKSLQMMDTKMSTLYQQLDAQKKLPIDIHIHSSGGSLTSGLYMYDLIKRIKSPVHTHVEGLAASAATLLSIAGDHRTMTKNSMMLIHQPSLTIQSQLKFEDTRDQYVNMKKYMDVMIDIYLEETKLDKDDLLNLIKNEQMMTSSECMQYGFIDEII